MKLVIGTDEAGYGPNIGPLVISASAWLISNREKSPPGRATCPDLFEIFSGFFESVKGRDRSEQNSGHRILVGDSKRIYQSGSGLQSLEHLVFRLVDCLDSGRDWKHLLEHLNCTSPDSSQDDSSPWQVLPWYERFNPELPMDFDLDSVDVSTEIKTDLGSFPTHQQSLIIEPEQFNAGCAEWGNKATLLSYSTLALVHKLATRLLDCDFGENVEQIVLICDKHGGRSKYAAMLQDHFTESWIQVVCEEQEQSTYKFEWKRIPVTVDFLTKGETELPIATASMISKYLREVCMLAFNNFWQAEIPGIRPTAGYPVDAKRFRREIATKINGLGLEEREWWRLK